MVRYAVLSDERGEYHILGLPTGQYALTVEQPGFQLYRQSGITLRLADRTAHRCEAGSRPAVAVRRGHRRRAAAADGQRRGEPERGREEDHHAAAGRAQFHSAGDALAGRGAAQRSVPAPHQRQPPAHERIHLRRHQRSAAGTGQVVYYPIIDGMAEFKLNVNAYSPEYGRSNGGTVMVIGKSGSNQFHGSLFEFFRNEALNARNLFAQPGPKPEFRRNQYGVTLGGPIQANKTFFFADWQGTRLRTGITRFSVVPTLAQRQGIFTQAIFDPATSPRTQFPNNTIPANRFDPIGQPDSSALPAAERRRREQFRPHRHRARQSGSGRFPGRPLLRRKAPHLRTLHLLPRRRHIRSRPARWKRQPDVRRDRARHHPRRRLRRRLQLDALALGAESVPRWLFPARSESDLAAERRHHGTGPAGEFLQLGAADLHRHRTSADRPDHRRELQFHHSITEFLDTFTMVRGRHTHQVRSRYPPRSAGCSEPAQSHRIVRASPPPAPTAPSVTGSGNALASLLLGQVNAFTHRHPEAGDSAARAHRRVLHRRRLEGFAAAHAEHRHALHAQLSVDRSTRSGRGLQSRTRRCWTSPTPRASWNAATSALAWDWRIGSAIAG